MVGGEASFLGNGEIAHVVELAACLLQLCRTHADELQPLLQQVDVHSSFNDLRQAFRDYVAGSNRMFRPGDLEARIRIEASERPLPDGGSSLVLAIRAAAEALQVEHGAHFYSYFKRKRLWKPGANQPFPVIGHQHHKAVRKASGNPSTRDPPYDSLDSLRLAPTDLSGFALEFRFFDEPVRSISQSTRFAIGVLHDRQIFSSNEIFRRYQWDRYEIGDAGAFFAVRPVDEKLRWEQVLEIVSAAARRKADILLLPELCLSEDLLQRLRAEPSFRAIPLVVPGSCHIASTGGGGSNVATAFASGKELGFHSKFYPVELHDEDGVVRREDLRGIVRRVTVFGNGSISFVVVICKDIIEDNTQSLLKKLRAHLVLIPAMSPTTQDFERFSESFGAVCQGYSIVANIGPNQGAMGGPWLGNVTKLFNFNEICLSLLDANGEPIPDA